MFHTYVPSSQLVQDFATIQSIQCSIRASLQRVSKPDWKIQERVCFPNLKGGWLVVSTHPEHGCMYIYVYIYITLYIYIYYIVYIYISILY